MRKKNVLLSLLIFTIIILFAANPEPNITAGWEGIKVWAIYLLPALFPFFVLTKLLSSSGTIEKISNKLSGITKFLFKAPGISMYVYLMSILSGYPVGAKIVADLYEKQTITREEAIKITTFTSTSGPLFIIGTVGVGMLTNFKLGLVILIAHLLGAILNGILYRGYGNKSEKNTISVYGQAPSNLLEDTMWSSIKSTLIIGGYVSVFFVIIHMLESYYLLYPINVSLDWLLSLIGISPGVSTGITSGFFEITRGCLVMSHLAIPLPVLSIILTFIISFGGLCIHLQALTFLKKFDMKMSFYFLIKTTQAVLSALICIPISMLLI